MYELMILIEAGFFHEAFQLLLDLFY